MEKVRGTMKEQHIHKSGRPLKKPNYDAAAILQDTVDQAVRYYTISGDKRAGNAVIESKIDHLAQSERISRHQHDTCNMMLGLP